MNMRVKVVTMSREIQTKAEGGQTMAEYTVVLGVITIAIVTTLAVLSGTINDAFVRTLEIVETAF
jgi:Flp pilus assembly pilin Flp